MADIETAIRQQIDEDPGLGTQRQQLNSIPGLGAKTIPTPLAYYGGPPRFDTAKRAVAFAGLDPRQHSSSRKRPVPLPPGAAVASTLSHRPLWLEIVR